MNDQSIEGKEVVLRSANGEIVRVVVKDLGEIVLISRPEEIHNAMQTGRQPVSMGFRRADILKVLP